MISLFFVILLFLPSDAFVFVFFKGKRAIGVTTGASRIVKSELSDIIMRSFSSKGNEPEGRPEHPEESEQSEQSEQSELPQQLDLSDWRAFRNKLISKTKVEMDDQNKQILEEQLGPTPVLDVNNVWAHEIPLPEVASLCVRMPFAYEMFRQNEEQFVAEIVEDGGSSGLTEEMVKKYCDSSAHYYMKHVSARINGRLNDIAIKSFKAEEGRRLKLDESTLSDKDRIFLRDYSRASEDWQSVYLVLGKSTSVLINRPLAQRMDDDHLTRLFLFGQNEKFQDGLSAMDSLPMTTLLEKFQRAFGSAKTCPLYYGGPSGINGEGNNQEPGIIIGPYKLSGARELSEGTGIFEGGLEDACDRIISGEAQPLDFRLFLGKTRYDYPKALYEQCEEFKLQPISCSRSLILKQCLQLPKPLFVELLECCGGQLGEIASIEFAKRG